MVFGRILFPSAKLALVDHARGTLLAAACGLDQAREDFDEDDLYGAMDELNGRWVPLEQQLYAQSFPQGVSLVLYDLSSVYFEGDGPVGISRYGHSRDHRSDRPQVILAVATDAQGIPLHIEVLRGNRGDTTTLQALLRTLRRRFGINEAVFVFDGGMSSKVNLAALEALGLRYVTRLGAGALEELLAQLPADQAPELWDRTQVMEIVREGKRYVIAGGTLAAAARPATTSGAFNQSRSRAQTPGRREAQKDPAAETGQPSRPGACSGSKRTNILIMQWTRKASCSGSAAII